MLKPTTSEEAWGRNSARRRHLADWSATGDRRSYRPSKPRRRAALRKAWTSRRGETTVATEGHFARKTCDIPRSALTEFVSRFRTDRPIVGLAIYRQRFRTIYPSIQQLSSGLQRRLPPIVDAAIAIFSAQSDLRLYVQPPSPLATDNLSQLRPRQTKNAITTLCL